MLSNLRRVILCPDLVAEALAKRSIQPRRVVLDFSSPNIAKTFHIGNLRSTLVGNFVQKIYRSAGHDVTSINYLGDWGTQFALLALHWREVALPEEEWSQMSNRQKVEHLTYCYVKANERDKLNPSFRDRAKELFAQMERASMLDPNATEPVELQWCREWRSVSRAYLQDFYTQFYNIHFDQWQCESEQVMEAHRVAEDLIRRGIAKQTADGFWCISQEYGGDRSVLRKSDDSSLYLTRDLGAIHNRRRLFDADEYAYVVERAQQRHFIQMKQILTAMDEKELAEKVKHIHFGRILGLSTRLGKNDSVDFLLEQGEREALHHVTKSTTIRLSEEEIPAVCKKLSESAIIFDLMRRHRATEYSFTFKGAFSEEQNSAFFMQDKHARLNSLLLKNQELMDKIYSTDNYGRMHLHATNPATGLLRLIFDFDTVVMGAYETLEPCNIVNYLLKLSSHAGKAIAALNVRYEPEATAIPRLMLFAAAKKVLGDGLRLLGIEPLEKI